jgi:hypothetical protein
MDMAMEGFLEGSYDEETRNLDEDKEWYKHSAWWKEPLRQILRRTKREMLRKKGETGQERREPDTAVVP